MCVGYLLLSLLCFWFMLFFFKQKTAYELRISDWSSDVCSSDLPAPDQHIESRPHDPAFRGVGGTGTGRAFRSTPTAVRQDRRLDPVPAFHPCWRCRPHADRRTDRRRQIGAAGAHGAAIPALSTIPDRKSTRLNSSH